MGTAQIQDDIKRLYDQDDDQMYLISKITEGLIRQAENIDKLTKIVEQQQDMIERLNTQLGNLAPYFPKHN